MKNFKSMASFSLTLLASAVLLAGCLDSSSDSNADTETRNLDLNFLAVNSTSENTDISADVCGANFSRIGTAAVNLTVADMAFYLHDLQLVTKDGQTVPVALNTTQWQEEGVALVDFQNKDNRCTGNAKPTNTQVLGEFEHSEGTAYDSVRFTVGLPSTLNHALPRPTTGILARTDLQWGWASGYKFLRMDTYPAGGIANHNGTTANAWAVHLGSTSCNTEKDAAGNWVTGTTKCDNPYLMQVELNGFDIDRPDIWVDLAAILAGSDMTQNTGGAVGCMSFDGSPECGPIFSRLGLAYNGIEGHQAEAQQLFRLAE